MRLSVVFVFCLYLMNLQYHFGTDDRFRMDSRFLESDSEDDHEGKWLIVQTNSPVVRAGIPQEINLSSIFT